ncbi:MAG: extracellular solute-binding protein [Alphaproteobacteria bacterium]|nr:MAG: extracellular solute-binding protein [Alphaproteobacteria bacterium]
MSVKTTLNGTTALNRRGLLKTAGATAALLAAPRLGLRPAQAGNPIEIMHWSWLAASDGEVWAKMIANFNEAHKDKGVQIKMEVVPEEQYVTKVLAAVATGKAPDFGWGTAGKGAQLARDEVVVPLDDLATKAGLDIADFSASSITAARYPKYDNKMFMIPMDLMSLQPEINLDHVKEAGLDAEKPPVDGATLIDWAKAMTKREGDKVTRSGIMMTGSGVQPTVTWGIVAEQMGFQRASDDLKTACVNPDAGKKAMQWVLDLFDKHKVSTRDVTDRGPGHGRSTAMSARSSTSRRRCSRRSATSLSPISRWAVSNFISRPTRAAMKRRWRRSNGFPTTASCGPRSGAARRRANRSSNDRTTRQPAIHGMCAAPLSTA